MKYYKLIIFLLATILLSFALIGCADTTYTISSDSSNSNSSTQSPVVQPFEMEHLGKSSEGIFDYYRDIATDVIYIRYRETGIKRGMGGLTIMLDPETGLPLTYTRYKEIYIASTGNGGAFSSD